MQFLLLVTAASDLLVHKILLNSVLVSPIAFAIWGIFLAFWHFFSIDGLGLWFTVCFGLLAVEASVSVQTQSTCSCIYLLFRVLWQQ